MSAHPSEGMDPILVLELSLQGDEVHRGICARVQIPGRQGRLQRSWPAHGKSLSVAQRDDLVHWMAQVLDEAVMWKMWAVQSVDPA